MQCRKCGKLFVLAYTYPWDDELADGFLYNSMYGCDTGCEYVRLKIECRQCGFEWECGGFGEFENDDECDEYLTRFSSYYNQGGHGGIV